MYNDVNSRRRNVLSPKKKLKIFLSTFLQGKTKNAEKASIL